MSVFKRGNVWWYLFRKDGVRIEESSGSRSRSLAVRAERQRRNELDEARNHLQPKQRLVKFEEAAEEWMESARARWGKSNLSIQSYSVKHLSQQFGSALLTSITAASIGKYQAMRRDEGASNRTVNMEVSTLRMILKHFKLWKAIEDDVKMLTEDKNVGKALTVDEDRRLLAACARSLQPSLLTAVVVFSNTGLRNGELRRARWSQVDFLNEQFTVGKAKTQSSSGRIVPLNELALDALQVWRARWPQAQDGDYIFPSEKLKQGEGGQMISYAVDKSKPLGSWKRSWGTAKKQAGVECRTHDLRHSLVSKLASTPGITAAVIREITGHSNQDMTDIYTHINQDPKRQALATLAKLNAPERVQ